VTKSAAVAPTGIGYNGHRDDDRYLKWRDDLRVVHGQNDRNGRRGGRPSISASRVGIRERFPKSMIAPPREGAR
jgi:hypothetical protein